MLCANKRCRASGSKLRNCGRCRAVGYCSSECQKEHWPVHKSVYREGLREELTKEIIDLSEQAKTVAASDGVEGLEDIVEGLTRLDVDCVRGKQVQRSVDGIHDAIRERYARKSPEEQAAFRAIVDSMKDMSPQEADSVFKRMRDLSKA